MKYIFFSFLLVFSCLSKAQVNSKDLSRAVKKRIFRVPEFSFIKEEADKLGVKVYLFGGTASAFGHYVRWDLEREAGDKKYQKERFDYDFTNIYRENQDLDIVVDGTVEQALVFEEILKEKYPHFVGNKEAWEVRLLRVQVRKKHALLNDPDFLNQHTDTNSTGMIAINDQGDNDFVFRDLFSWVSLSKDTEESAFLKDVSNARITFLYSKTHNETTRYKEGKNPPIFAAIRYLAKLAQYELEEVKEDLDLIKEIIKETDWAEVQKNSYIKYKLEEFGKKVLLNAPSSEYAWNLLEDTGLRKKLIEMDGDQIQKEGTLSWWMNKEPLRSKSVGLGRGKHAKEIFLSQMDKNGEIILSHETSDFNAYENITRSSRGGANAFISREGVRGENAANGDGFYTKLGFKGARGTNLTVRFKLNLEAREGSDFIYESDHVILKNKKAITLIQENINITLKDFIKLMLNGGVKKQDLGLIEKMKRKFKRKVFEKNEIDEAVLYLMELHTLFFMKPSALKLISKKPWILYLLPAMETSKYFDRLLTKLIKNKKLHNKLLEYFFSQEVSVQYEKQLDFIISSLDSKVDSKVDLIKHVFSKKHWEFKHSLIDEIIKEGKSDEIFAIINYILPNKVNRKWFLQISKLRNNYDSNIYNYGLIKNVLFQPIWKKSKDFNFLLEKFIKNKKLYNDLLKYFFSQEESLQYEEQLDFIINNSESKVLLIKYIFLKKHWKSKHSLIDIDKIIKEGKSDEILAIINYVLPNKVNRNWFLQISKLRNGYYNFWLIKNVLSQPIWKNNGELITNFLKNDRKNSNFDNRRDLIAKIAGILILPHWREHSDWYSWVEKIILSEIVNSVYVAKYIFTLPTINLNWVEKFLFSKDIKKQMKEQLQFDFIKSSLHLPHWNRQIDIINQLLDNSSNVERIAYYVLSLPHMIDHPNLVKKAILKSKSYNDLLYLSGVLTNKGWDKFPEILVMLIQKIININAPLEDNIARVLKLAHWKDHPDLMAFAGKENFTMQDIYLKSQEYDFVDFKNNKKISSNDGKLYSGKKLYSTSGQMMTCTALLN